MDDIIISIGAFGRYQKFVLMVIGLISSLTATTLYSSVFTANQPKIECSFNNGTYQTNNFTSAEKCDIIKKYLNSKLDNSSNNNSSYFCKLDESFYYSFVNQWGLVCERTFLASLTQTLYFIGTVGSLFVGFLSDRFGRKKIAFSLAVILCFTSIMSEILLLDAVKLSDDAQFIVYCISQCLMGFSAKGLYLVSYILLVELTTPKYGTIVSNINLYMYVVGELFVLFVAYFFKNWHVMNRTVAVYALILVVVIAFLLPESPRFLMQKGRREEVRKLLTKIAKINGKSSEAVEKYYKKARGLSETAKELISTDNENNDSSNVINEEESEDVSKKSKNKSDTHLLWKPCSNLLKTSLFTYLWFALNLIYYGVSLGITGLDDQLNPYLMYLLSSLAEILGYVSCHLNDKFGRKKIIIFFLISASAVCLVVALIPTDASKSGLSTGSIFKIIFASLGKAMASAAFNSAYIYNTLLYPTSVRSSAVLLSSNIGGIGSFISPQINLLQNFWKPLPYIVFSSSSLLASIFVLLLPDPDKIKFF